MHDRAAISSRKIRLDVLHDPVEVFVCATESLAALMVSNFRLIRFYAGKSIALPGVEIFLLAVAF